MFGLKSKTTAQPAEKKAEQPGSGAALNQHFWMPFSANRDFRANPRMIAGAEGRYYIDDQGRKLFDSLSGLWTCGAGHIADDLAHLETKRTIRNIRSVTMACSAVLRRSPGG